MKRHILFYALILLLVFLKVSSSPLISFAQTGTSTAIPYVTNRKIVFVTSTDPNSVYISVVDADGENQHRLADGFNPAWSPDGSLIAFTAVASPGIVMIYVMNADGGNLHALVTADDDEQNPQWSPDGNFIAFRMGGSIYIVNKDGTNLHSITNPDDKIAFFHWSPNGKFIAFNVDFPNLDVGIYTLNVSNLETQKLTNEGYDPVWSPDGKVIAYPTTADQSIHLIDPQGNSQQTLTTDKAIVPTHIVWSPDGKQFLLVSTPTGDASHIYIMNADGTNLHRLTNFQDNEYGPDWSPDGKQIIFSLDGVNPGLYLFNVERQEITRIINDEGIYLQFWQP